MVQHELTIGAKSLMDDQQAWTAGGVVEYRVESATQQVFQGGGNRTGVWREGLDRADH
jgi:hypothetical protein